MYLLLFYFYLFFLVSNWSVGERSQWKFEQGYWCDVHVGILRHKVAVFSDGWNESFEMLWLLFNFKHRINLPFACRASFVSTVIPIQANTLNRHFVWVEKFSIILKLKYTHALAKTLVSSSAWEPKYHWNGCWNFSQQTKNMLRFPYEQIYFEFPTKDLDLELIAQCAQNIRLCTL